MNELKIGDECWWFRTAGYHSEPQETKHIYLEHIVIAEIDEDWVLSTNGESFNIKDIFHGFKSKQEAINAMIQRLNQLKNE